MTLNEIINKMESIKKGTFQKFEIETNKEPLAKFKGNVIKKHTQMIARFGIAYGNMASHKTQVVGSLPWGQWVKGQEGYIIENNNKYYLRFYTSNVKSSKVEWTLNGKPTTKEWLENNKYISKNNKPMSDTFVVHIENIISIGAQ